MVKSPAVSPNRPLALRRESGELETYIDMYGLSKEARRGNSQATLTQTAEQSQGEAPPLFYSDDVAQELRNLQNLRRLSLDISNFDPDVPPQNYEIAPVLQAGESGHPNSEEEANLGSSLYWVPARIHPELAPQEWQSFVQKRDGKLTESFQFSQDRGLARSKSLLSREVNERSAEKYTDAGPLLEKRRSMLQTQIKVSDLENLPSVEHETETRGLSLLNPRTHSDLPEEGDTPILVPPPGQILRRAARTGKAKLGSSRRLGRVVTAPLTPPGETPMDDVSPWKQLSPSNEFGIQLHDDGPIRSDATSPVFGVDVLGEHPDHFTTLPTTDQGMERKKSRNRTVQILAAKDIDTFVVPSTENSQDKFSGNWLRTPMMVEPLVPESPVTLLNSVEKPAARPAGLVEDTLGQKNNLKPITRPLLQQIQTKSAIPEVVEHNTSMSKPSSPVTDLSPARPGLKRELSAASLTRAVMNGTAPVPALVNPIPRANTEPILSDPVANSKKSTWEKLFSSEDRHKSKKESKAPAKLKRSPSNDEHQAGEKENTSNNLFSSIFGKKKEKDSHIEVTRRSTTPTPQHRNAQALDPQFYARFPVQLERAIYRMAHLKLGNSRRPLVHQVLLSNFMYGYLAIVGANASGSGHAPAHQRNRPQITGSGSKQGSPRGQGSSDNQWRSTNRQRPSNDGPKVKNSQAYPDESSSGSAESAFTKSKAGQRDTDHYVKNDLGSRPGALEDGSEYSDAEVPKGSVQVQVSRSSDVEPVRNLRVRDRTIET